MREVQQLWTAVINLRSAHISHSPTNQVYILLIQCRHISLTPAPPATSRAGSAGAAETNSRQLALTSSLQLCRPHSPELSQ